MATVIKLRSDIKKLKKAIETKGISDSIKSKLKVQLEKVENELAAMQKGGKPRKVSTTKGTATALSALQKLIKRKKYGVYQGKGVDLKKDANEGAMATGRRVSKGLKANQFGSKGENKGNVYYEYRPNRLDVKQPRKAQRYPKLEKGGMISYKDALDKFNEKLLTNEGVLKASEHYNKTPQEVLREIQSRISVFRYKDKSIKEVKIDFSDSNSNISIKEKLSFEDGGIMADGGKTDGKNGYIAIYKGKRIEVYADTKYAAQLKAAKILNAKKSYDVIVELAEVGGEQHYNSTMFATGGMVAGRYYKDAAGNELRFIGESGGMGLFRDKDGNAIKKDFSDFNKAPKESKLFGWFEKGGSLLASTKYVPNRDVKELSVIMGNSLKNLKGSDIVDGVYVKKSALSSLSKKVAAKKSSSSLSVDDVYNRILKKAEELGVLDAGDEKKIKKTDIKKLINAGYDSEDINVIYLGADALEVAKIDKEYSAIDGLMSYREDAIPNYIDRYVKAAKDGKFEIGLKYPEFNWSDIVKKYKISKDGKEIDGKVYDYGDEKEHYVYTIFEGENVVIGTSTNRVRYKNGVKQPEDNYYKRDPKELAKFQGGYWGIVSSSKDVIKDIARMILRKGTGYVKDVNVFINALGGVDSDDLDKNNIKYENGGYNSGASWSMDRARHNKSEDYEIPMNKRKLEDGGVISKTHRIG